MHLHFGLECVQIARWQVAKTLIYRSSAGIGALRCLPLLCYDLIKSVSAGEMGTGETVLRQKAAGQITAKPRLAIHIDRLTPV